MIEYGFPTKQGSQIGSISCQVFIKSDDCYEIMQRGNAAYMMSRVRMERLRLHCTHHQLYGGRFMVEVGKQISSTLNVCVASLVTRYGFAVWPFL